MGVFLFVPAAMGSSSRKSDKKSKEHKKKKVVEPESESSEEVEVPEEEVEDNVQEDSSNEDSSEEESPSVGQKRKLEQKENGDAKKTRQVTTMLVGNLPWSASEDEIREFFGDLNITDLRMMTDRQTGNFKGFCYVDFADEESAEKAYALAGTEYNGREIKVDYTQAAATNNNAYNNAQGEKSLTCFVGNLSYDTDEDSIRAFFGEAGSVASVRMITDRDTGAPKGFCYVQFEDQEGADTALTYHGNELDGRNIRVTYDTHKPDRGGNRGRGGRGGGRGFGDRGGRGFGGRGGGRGFGDRGGRGGRGGRGFGDRGGRGGRGRGFGDRGGRGGRGGRGAPPSFAGK